MNPILSSIFRRVSPTERKFKKIWPKIDSIEGLLMHGQEKWLFETARKLKDQSNIVEIGCYQGRSTVSLGYGCAGTRKHIYSIDTFNGNDSDFQGEGRRDFFQKWKTNVSQNRLDEYVTPVTGDSRVVGKEWNRPIEFLFIDASHVYEDALSDFDLFYPHVVPGGVIAMHDVGSHSGPTRVWEERKGLLVNTGSVETLSYGWKPYSEKLK
jgi:predicted O-methyltransferase YrrM